MEKSRIAWIDYAKGFCIVAVVTFYATTHIQDGMGSIGWMDQVVQFAQPFRMPDFFLLSGLFVAQALTKPLPVYLDRKVLHFLYFYVVWITLRALLQDGQELLGPNPGEVVRDYAKLYLQPHGQLWFIYLLPLFFLASRLTRQLPPLLILFVAAILKLLEIHTGWKLIDRFCMYFLYFHIGHIFAPRIFALANWAQKNIRAAAAFLLIWAVLNGVAVGGGWTWLPGMQLILGLAGGVAVLMLSALLSRAHWMNWLRYLGQNSLIIYLGFVIPLTLMRKIVTIQHAVTDVGLLCLATIVACIAGALVLERVVRYTPMRILFHRPAWLRFKSRSPIGAKVAPASTVE